MANERQQKSSDDDKLSAQGAWSMAVGGMVGGGIFSTLGLVISIAGPWAWLSFVLAGLVALASGYAYVKLVAQHGEGGGAFTFLREIDEEGFAGSLSWVLLMGYVLTNAVYAITFGEYLGHVFGLSGWFPRVSAIAVMTFFVALNLRSVGETGIVEVFLVWFKLVVLVGLACWGLVQWQPSLLSRGVPDGSLPTALYAAATVFMAYEGFELLSYDYDDLESPRRTLHIAILTAIPVVIVVYVIVALGTTMLVGADQIVRHQEVALSIAGQKALGTAGLILVTIGASFSTGSAINSTLFATARLAREVAEDGELPAAIDHNNKAGIPDRSIIGLGVAAAVLAALGSLSMLVQAASMAFLFNFAVVCGLAFYQRAGSRIITGLGTIATSATTLALMYRMLRTNPISLGVLAVLVLIATVGRPQLLKRVRVEHP